MYTHLLCVVSYAGVHIIMCAEKSNWISKVCGPVRFLQKQLADTESYNSFKLGLTSVLPEN